MFQVEKPGSRHTETMGLPLTIMANVAKEEPEKLNEETRVFLTSMAPMDEYQEYITGNFNSFKWSHADRSIVDKTSVFDILRMTAHCIIVSPSASAKAFCILTDMVYGLDGEITADLGIGISENDFGFEYEGKEDVKTFLDHYKWMFNHTILKYFSYIGTTILVMAAFILAKCNLRCRKDWIKILLCIPIFVYDFGTMLLLTGPDSRFFYVSFLVCPLVVLTVLKEDKF